ncbi:hypothetical protein [Rhodoferax sp. TS-BS-61-7]|uniref:hypothetical protein n=1 Tax=Rhodoferax sp. TS-BS-61-7 TaxID=2094194 RepID=UPI000CF70E93|nr:hypothetical protein [Rhodoferax sp. TS-BS-61-7]PQA79297.1 hypothetical protein C5F53_04975 [Rhodoferax sp. TS-BS-61-7]
MPRAIVLVLTLVGILVIPLMLKKCTAPKTPPVAVAPSGAPLTPAASAPEPAGNKPIGYGLTFGLAPLEDKDPKDVANMVCDAGESTLDRAYKGACNPNVGDTSCRIVLPVLCIKKGDLPRPGGLSGSGWSRSELAATQAVMGATLDSEMKANVMCERELGPGWRMATFADGGNHMDDQHYDHEARGDVWALQGKLGPGIGGYGRYWVHSQGQTANCWD